MHSIESAIEALGPLIDRLRIDATAKRTGKRVEWTREPLTAALLAQHLKGGPARGVSQIKAGESVTRVAVLDFDNHGGDVSWPEMAEIAAKVEASLSDDGIEVTAFRSSGGRGVHLYALWDEPQDAYSVRRALIKALGRVGLQDGTKGVSQRQTEVFPKQNSVPADGFGNQVFLPMSGKSEPLDLLFGEVTGFEGLLSLAWPMSRPVPVLAKPPVTPTSPPGIVSAATLRSALARIPNDSIDQRDYGRWWGIIAALHEGSGGSAKGLALAEEFSKRNAAVYELDPTHLSAGVALPEARRSRHHASINPERSSRTWVEAAARAGLHRRGRQPSHTDSRRSPHLRAECHAGRDGKT